MKMTRRSFVASAAAGIAVPSISTTGAFAQEKVVRISAPMDFTRIYTFVTSEYSQGQRDYFTLLNERGGVGGYKIVVDVSDHANDLPRAIEAYERGKREGAVKVLLHRARKSLAEALRRKSPPPLPELQRTP